MERLAKVWCNKCSFVVSGIHAKDNYETERYLEWLKDHMKIVHND